MPSRASGNSLACALTVKNSLPMRRPPAYTRLKSAAVRRRRARGKVCGCGAAAARAPMIIAVEGAQLRTQALAALGAPACQDRAAVLRGHTGPKSMRACAAHLARLISTFHDDFKA